MSVSFDSLEDLYDNGSMWEPGVEFEYREYLLKKVDLGPPDHSEFKIINDDGIKVESVTVSAFDSFESFKSFIDEVVDYDPDSLEDWLNRSK